MVFVCVAYEVSDISGSFLKITEKSKPYQVQLVEQ